MVRASRNGIAERCASVAGKITDETGRAASAAAGGITLLIQSSADNVHGRQEVHGKWGSVPPLGSPVKSRRFSIVAGPQNATDPSVVAAMNIR